MKTLDHQERCENAVSVLVLPSTIGVRGQNEVISFYIDLLNMPIERENSE